MATRQHSADPWDAAAAAHLLSRAAFGPTPEAVARLTAMTRQEAVEALIVHPDPVLFGRFEPVTLLRV